MRIHKLKEKSKFNLQLIDFFNFKKRLLLTLLFVFFFGGFLFMPIGLLRSNSQFLESLGVFI